MRTVLPFAVLALLLGSGVEAAGLRCGNDLVQRGDSVRTVTDKCGPAVREADLVNHRGKVIGLVRYYDPGYGRADRRVVFRQGRVRAIERMR